MNAWINQMAEITRIRQISIDVIISELGSMVLKPGVFWIIAAIVLFLIMTSEYTYHEEQQHQNSDAKQD
ncbi:hypothetical protein ACFL3F_05640 [Planctomycetota bacterium]